MPDGTNRVFTRTFTHNAGVPNGTLMITVKDDQADAVQRFLRLKATR